MSNMRSPEPGTRVGDNIFDVRKPPHGKQSGRQILAAGETKNMLREWAAAPDAFSTTLIMGVNRAGVQTVNDDASDAFWRVGFGSAFNSMMGQDDCQTVDIDLCQGMAITLIGNCMISVDAIYGPLTFAAVGAVQPTLNLFLSISHGMNVTNARRTVKVGNLAQAGVSAILPIPNFAREGYLVNNDAVNTPTAIIRQFGNTVGGTALSQDFISKKSDGTTVVADSAVAFQLTAGGFAVPNAAVVWTLNL